eukprot:Nk52_evm8s2438 gene=Nk52_evmTU8s2438
MSYYDESFYLAVLAIVFHVVNYNVTAHLEYNTKAISKLLGNYAVYYYAAYLIASAVLRDSIIRYATEIEVKEIRLLVLDRGTSFWLGAVLCGGTGVFLNLWTLQKLGIKGMYNGDSFGFLMDAPVTDGPYRFFSDPQYVGTTLAMFGYAIHMQSCNGLILTFVMGLTFYISARFVETPHMNRIYAQRDNKVTDSGDSKKLK